MLADAAAGGAGGLRAGAPAGAFVGARAADLLVTQLLPGIVVATPLFVLFSQLALLNSYLGLILADATLTVPFAILILRPFFLRMPKELESAAMVDGCRPLGAFLRVVLPVSRPGVITVAVLASCSRGASSCSRCR